MTDLEFLVVKVEDPHNSLIATVYRPPDYIISKFLPNLSSLVDALQVMNHNSIIVCGDFNEDQLSNSEKPILKLFHDRGFSQMITTPTTKKYTLLDLLFIPNPCNNVKSGVLETYHS